MTRPRTYNLPVWLLAFRTWPPSVKLGVLLVITTLAGFLLAPRRWIFGEDPLMSTTLSSTHLSSAMARATRLSRVTTSPVRNPTAAVLASIFRRHCKYDVPPGQFEDPSAYHLPQLAKLAMEHCPDSTSLPFTSVDVWLDHADVAIVDHTRDPLLYEMELDEKCNDLEAAKACVIFTTPALVRSPSHGAPLLLRVVQRPFVLITGDNEDECVPYRSSSHEGPPEVDDLLRSPLLRRWYGKNVCIHEGHSDGQKMRALPLGPKWQFKTTAFHGEDASVIKKRLMEAGAGDPRAMWRVKKREKSIHVAMVVRSALRSWYLPARGIRQRAKDHLDSAFKTTTATKSAYVLAEVKGKVDHPTYLHSLATQAFTLSPPGRGLDAHRTWEALVLGCIPVVWHSPINPLYQGLPVVVIQDPQVLTPRALAEWDATLHAQEDSDYRFEKLYAFYWLGLIEEDRRL